CYWYENPQGKPGLWKEHLLTNSACNETPIFVDLFGTGKRVLVMGWRPASPEKGGEVCYFTPGKDPTQPWERHSISGSHPEGKDGPVFLTKDVFLPPPALAKLPLQYQFSPEEEALYAVVNKTRAEQKRGPWRTNWELCWAARALAGSGPQEADRALGRYKGKV